MPTAVTEIASRPAVQDPPRKRWTRTEYAAAEASGVFDRQRLELIDGELFNKMPKKRPHVAALALLLEWFLRVFGGRFVNSEAPIDVAPEDNPTNEPQPDLIVLKSGYSKNLDRHAAAERFGTGGRGCGHDPGIRPNDQGGSLRPSGNR